MLDWLLQSDFNTQVTAAIWSTIVAISSAIVLFFYTLGLRLATIREEQRRVPLIARWRRIFATAVVSDVGIGSKGLPVIKRSEEAEVLEEWNLSRNTVAGDATENLVDVAKRLGFPAIAHRMLRRGNTSAQLLAIQTLGHLKDESSWSTLLELVDSENGAISVTAATALVDIDAGRAIRVLVPLIPIRRDWLQTRVAMFLRTAGSELISEPLFREIRTAEPEAQIFLMKFAPLTETSVGEAIAEDLVRYSQDAGVLGAALKMMMGYGGLPRIAELAVHESWLVRLGVAELLGRAGARQHLPLLEALLNDQQWWVRYRAAQSIVSLPFLGPNSLHQLQARQTDHFARDILAHVMAEAGL